MHSEFCPYHQNQQGWLILKASHPQTELTYFFIDKCLPFGANVSCALFQSFSDALVYLAEKKLMIQGLMIFVPITNYLDDFLFIAFLENLCNNLMQNFLAICDEVNCPISEEKTQWASPTMIFLGMLLNGATLTVCIPIKKLDKTVQMINQLISKKKVTIKLIQQVTGILNFLNRAVVPRTHLHKKNLR